MKQIAAAGNELIIYSTSFDNKLYKLHKLRSYNNIFIMYNSESITFQKIYLAI